MNLEHKEDENKELAWHFDDNENHPGLQTLVQEHFNNALVDQRMNSLQVISDNEAQDYVPKLGMLIFNIPTERPNAKEKQLSLNMFFSALTIDSRPTKKVLPIHPNDEK
jgi:hypothetical protein